MTLISTNNNVLTFINVFTVEPENQERLIDLLTSATDVSVRYAPGFISCSLHRGQKGRKLPCMRSGEVRKITKR